MIFVRVAQINFLYSFNFKVNVILFVRNQKEWILSDYIQNVKGGGTYSLEKYLQISLQNESEKYPKKNY